MRLLLVFPFITKVVRIVFKDTSKIRAKNILIQVNNRDIVPPIL